ncbi:MAG: MMPL family transporter [Spirochaetota bacterium]|nr:MMPL family transporter [Spirochaetota bacterium]
MNRLIDLIIKQSKYVLISVILISIPFGYFYTKQRFSNHVDIYFNQDDPDLIAYRKFQEIYGNEEQVVIVFKDRDIFTKKNIEIIRMISNEIKDIKGIQRLFSITEAEESIGIEDTISFTKIIPEDGLDKQKLNSARQRVLDNKLLVHNLISIDGTTTAIIIEIESTEDSKSKRELLKNIKNCANNIAGDSFDLRFSGPPYVEDSINALSERDYIIFTPIILLIIFSIIALMLKKISLSILCQLNLGLIGIWAIGFFTLCNESMNMVTTIIAPVLLAISVADAIHLLSHYREMHVIKGNDYTTSVTNAAKSIWLPCLFTSLTTGIGFLSFITATVRPVKIVGIFTSIGIMMAFFMTFTFLPSTLILFKRRFEKNNSNETNHRMMSTSSKQLMDPPSRESLFTNILLKFGGFTITNYKAIIVFFVLILIIAVIGITRLRFETNIDTYLPDGNKIKSDIKFIEENLGGNIPHVILVKAKSEEFDFTHPHSLKLIEEIQNDLMRDIKHFSISFSIADYFKEIHRAFNNNKEEYYRIPEKQIDIIDYYELADIEVLDRIISPDYREARISFQSKGSSNIIAKRNYKFVNNYMKRKTGENYSYNFTGLSPLSLNIADNLQTSQIKSFLYAFVFIFFMMFFVCRNAKLTIISMIPNLFPIILTLGIMGWLNIPLDVTTIMIASVTIGIAVDDTIHYLIWFIRNGSSGMDNRSSILKTYKDVGKPIVITTLVLILGFFVLVLGSIKPTQAFGTLTALSMCFALIGDLFFLPALIIIFKPRFKKKD